MVTAPPALEDVLFEESWLSWSPVGVEIHGRPPTYGRWEHAIHTALGLRSGSTWALVDLYLAGEIEFGERASQAISPARISPKRLANILWVGRRFPVDLRRSGLSFSHHEAVAGLLGNPEHPEWQQEGLSLLAKAELEEWPVELLEEEVRKVRGPRPGSGPVASLRSLRDRLHELSGSEELEDVSEHLDSALAQLDLALAELKEQAKEGAL
jgi:hypothetical protein